MRVVIALGGNALIRRGQPPSEATQRQNVEIAAQAVAEIAREHEVIVTHGNGPQVGLLALENEAFAGIEPYGLDVLGAESQGMIGILLEQALRNQLPDAKLATLLTMVLVDREDPAFAHPSKPIGLMYSEAEARRLAGQRGWSIHPDGAGFRRVVPSPRPTAILALDAIRVLADAGVLVICAGGGGVPFVRTNGNLESVEGVVDKDLTSALLAEQVNADCLLLLTDVPAVQSNWGSPSARDIRATTPRYLKAMTFAEGSMAPKIDAACQFVERTAKLACIGSLEDAYRIMLGERGTIIRPN